MRATPLILVFCLVLGAATDASATYSPPLTEVRIDSQQYLHTPSIVYANERRTSPGTDVELAGWGLQYLGQFEFESGFGLLVGVAGGFGTVDGEVGRAGVLAGGPAQVETDGFWLGGQLRAYQMVWKSKVDEAVERPSAITVFVNLRTLFYDMSSNTIQREAEPAELEFFTLTGGAGFMAEWSITDYFSICPYAWVTPGVLTQLDYEVRGQKIDADQGFSMRNPFLVGIDFWLYTVPPNWTDHFSLSVLGSFVDFDGDDQAIAVVLGYTF